MAENVRFLTTFEVAKLCHASPGSVVRWIRDGKLQASVTPGGHHRIQLPHLLAFLKTLKMPVPLELKKMKRGSSLVVSSDPECIKRIHRMLRLRFPNAVVKDSHEP